MLFLTLWVQIKPVVNQNPVFFPICMVLFFLSLLVTSKPTWKKKCILLLLFILPVWERGVKSWLLCSCHCCWVQVVQLPELMKCPCSGPIWRLDSFCQTKHRTYSDLKMRFILSTRSCDSGSCFPGGRTFHPYGNWNSLGTQAWGGHPNGSSCFRNVIFYFSEDTPNKHWGSGAGPQCQLLPSSSFLPGSWWSILPLHPDRHSPHCQRSWLLFLRINGTSLVSTII